MKSYRIRSRAMCKFARVRAGCIRWSHKPYESVATGVRCLRVAAAQWASVRLFGADVAGTSTAGCRLVFWVRLHAWTAVERCATSNVGPRLAVARYIQYMGGRGRKWPGWSWKRKRRNAAPKVTHGDEGEDCEAGVGTPGLSQSDSGVRDACWRCSTLGRRGNVKGIPGGGQATPLSERFLMPATTTRTPT